MRIFALGCFLGLLACQLDPQTYGGTTSGSTASHAQTASTLIASGANLLQIDSSTSVVYGSSPAIAKLTNLAATRTAFTSPTDLTPDNATLGQSVGGWIKIAPSTNGLFFSSPLSNVIETSSFAIVAVLKPTSRGEIFRSHPSDMQNQAFDLSVDGQYVRGRFWNSPSDYYESKTALPSGDAMIVAASFSGDATQISLSVNGSLEKTVVSTGSTSPPNQVNRLFSLGPTLASSSIEIKELYVFSRSLANNEIGAMVYVMGQKHGIPVTLSPDLKAPSDGVVSDPNFAPAQSIIAQKCASCHSSWGNARATYYVSNGLVAKNSALTSKLYFRLTGSSGGSGPKNMPQSAPGLTSAELSTIQKWIDEMP